MLFFLLLARRYFLRPAGSPAFPSRATMRSITALSNYN